jgi:hypothetical protein
MPRGHITTIAELRERCVVDPVTRCWHWQGAQSRGQPRIYALDLSIMDKRVMPGTRAAWQIAHGEPIAPGRMIYRVCGCRDCVNPVHLREARSLAEVGANIRGSGRLKGKFTEAKRASLEKAWASAGFKKQPEEVVRAIRQAPAEVTGYALSKLHGVSESVVSRIRRGETYRGLV